MSLSENRHHENRLKNKTKKIISKWFSKEPTEKQIGQNYSVHSSGCSCKFCGNPRRHFDDKTIQEKRFEIDDE